jgi:hypothetical protein
MTPDHGLAWESVAREVAYYNSVVERYRGMDKKLDVRLRHAALHNLFAIYYFLEDIENATKYARFLMQTGYDNRKAEEDLRLVTAMENDFRRIGIRTQHFSVYDLYVMDGHGNDWRYDPRGNVGTYLNNGYYDGYGQGWSDGYRARYRDIHRDNYNYHYHDDRYRYSGGNHDYNDHNNYGPRTGSGNGGTAPSRPVSPSGTVRPTSNGTTAPSSSVRPTGTATPSRPSSSSSTAPSSTVAPSGTTRPTSSSTTTAPSRPVSPSGTTRPTSGSTTAPSSTARPSTSSSTSTSSRPSSTQPTARPAASRSSSSSTSTETKTEQAKPAARPATAQPATRPATSRPTRSR